MNRKNKVDQYFIIFWIFLFVFQSLLSKISSLFDYIDEAPIILFCCISFLRILKRNAIQIKRNNRNYYFALFLFVCVGLLGNLVYHYQKWSLVAVDLLTNLKFYGAIAFFSLWIEPQTLETKNIPNIAIFFTIVLSTFFVVDRVVDIFPAEYRYGIKSAVLFYAHPTYLAGVCAFLIAIMTIYNSNKYRLFIMMDLVLLAFTLRSKAIVSVIVYGLLYFVIKVLHGKLKIWQIVVLGISGIVCAWSQIYFYFIKLAGQSARSVMFITSLLILRDYFPIGTGFATYASHSAAVNYSPVYTLYGFEEIYELRNSTVGTFFDDQFWPIIFGQTGVIGTICYLYALCFIFRKIQKLYRVNVNAYMGALFVFIYLLISSIAEPAFNNSVAIPLAMVIVVAMKKEKTDKTKRIFA